MSLDRMTVRTPNLALGDFRLGLSKALGVTHIEHLVADMIEVKRVRVRVVSAVYASGRGLERIQPAPYGRGAFIGHSVHALSVPGLLQSSGSPLFDLLLWGRRSDTGPVLTQDRTKLSRPFCSECATALLAFKRLFLN
jgi:hypothetical protein